MNRKIITILHFVFLMTNEISSFVKFTMSKMLYVLVLLKPQEDWEKVNHFGKYYHQVLHKFVGSMPARVLKQSMHKVVFIFYSNNYAYN